MSIRNVVVVGAGTMGSGIAQVFAQYGHKVVLHDRERGDSWERAARAHRPEPRQADGMAGKLEPGSRESTLVPPLDHEPTSPPRAGADLVVEAVPESFDLKTAVLFAKPRQDRARENAILATNTSSIFHHPHRPPSPGRRGKR